MSTRIEWTDETWNPVTGCSKVSPGCKNCYAERMATRLRGRFGYPADDPFRLTLHPHRLLDVTYWDKPRMVFTCSMSDLFHKDVPDHFLGQVFDTMTRAINHTFQVLTKRPSHMVEYLRSRGTIAPNVWLGVSCEDQQRADERVPPLLKCPAAVRFVSLEPLLGPIDLDAAGAWSDSGLDWAIAGGETGPGARPINLNWVRSIRDQCQAAQVPFFYKQANGKGDRELDGRTWDEMPVVADSATTETEVTT